MKKKGFTLVELLAVIVILAVIALITIPIVIKTINNSQNESEKQSIAGYARAIEDDIANYMIINPGNKYENYTPTKDFDYKGNKVFCFSRTVSSTGKLTLNNCYVSDKELTSEEIKEKKIHLYKYENGKVIPIGNSNQSGEDGNQSVAKTAVQELLAKTNPESVTAYEQGSNASHQMYTFSHPATEQAGALTDYRYIGSDPYNYVDFNCDDNRENCETWRIVGVFTVSNGTKEEQRIKLIKDERLSTDMNWDEYQDEFCKNEWPSSTLNTYLNGDFYQSMSDLTKSMVEQFETYLGGRSWFSTTNWGTASDMYTWERGTNVYSSHSIKDTKSVTLLYPSDYAYTYANGVDNVCYSDGFRCSIDGGVQSSAGWLYKSYWWWLVSPGAGNSVMAFAVDSYGHVGSVSVTDIYGVRPVTYLKSSVQIDSGTGTSSDPYKLKI